MKKLVTKSELKTVTLKELNSYELPKWQRWKNEKNVDSLVNSLNAIGQQREILVCELENGRKLLTDGNHLRNAMNKLKYNTCSIRLNKVKEDIDAFNLFVEFNTRGRSLSTLDFVVSRSSFGDNNPYKTFLNDILNNPRTDKEARLEATRHSLFTVPALLTIFLGSTSAIKSGKSKLPKNYDRAKGLFRYLNENYVYRKEIVKLTKNNKSKKLNGGSIVPVMNTILLEKYSHLGYSQILDILVDFSVWFSKKNPDMQFNKDNVGTAFREYLSLNEI